MTEIDPSTSALMVMDYQVGITGSLPDAQPLIDRANAAITDARDHGAHVGWVRVAFTDDDFDAIPSTSMFAAMATPERRAALHADAPTSQIDSRLAPQHDDISVRKVRVGAFTTTDLADQLARRGVDTLVLAGISTSGVVLSTVREAMDRDYRIVVLEDACADPVQATHEFLTGTVFPRHATVITVADLHKLWKTS